METLEMYFIEKFEIRNFRQESISWNITEYNARFHLLIVVPFTRVNQRELQ